MSYAMCDIIFGIPLTEAICADVDDLEYDSGDPEGFGFVGLYTAGGPGAGYCGVKLCRIDECNNEKASELKMEPTDADRQEFARLWKAVPEDIREVIPDSTPTVWLVWHSS